MTAQELTPEQRQLLREACDRAEQRLREQYLSGWLQALNNPEEFRRKGQLIGECMAAVRGELTGG